MGLQSVLGDYHNPSVDGLGYGLWEVMGFERSIWM